MIKKIILIIISVPISLAFILFIGSVMIPYSSHHVKNKPGIAGLLNPTELSQELLLAVKTGEKTDSLENALCAMDEIFLIKELPTQNQKRAFWINLYNAFSQTLLEKDTNAIRTWKGRLKHYSSRKICVAGNMLSLNDIEHGMLRHSKVWWSMGYLNKWFPNRFEKKMRVPLDNRIHFSLNCGAKSCPAIAFYNPENLDQQLNLATKVYLKQDVSFDQQGNTVNITELAKWYKNDFGGKKGIITFLKKYELIPADAVPEIRYHDYDWSVLLKSFRQ